MALIKCKECGREISDKSKQCIHCGCPIENETECNEDMNQTPTKEKEENGVVPKKKSKKILFIAIPVILIILFFGVVMIFGQTDIEKELEMVEKIFSLNYKEIMEEYTNAELKYSDNDNHNLSMEGEFAGRLGEYTICVLDDGSVWCVVFEPDEQGGNIEETIDIISASLGKHVEYDSEWNYYTWQTNNLEIEFWEEENTYFDWIGEDLEVNEIVENEKESSSNNSLEYADMDFLIEDELGMVENLFSLNYKEIMAEYPNVEESSPDSNDRDRGLYIDSTFAEVQGEYYVYIYDGVVESVIFEPQDESADGIKIVEALKASLGKYEEYDSEWDSYIWETENLEIKCYAEERTYFEWVGEELEVSDITDNEIGVVENIYTATDIPDELMNDEFKHVIDLFSKGFSQSELDISKAETYDDGDTYIFYLDNLEFLGDECDDSHLQPRIIYEKDAIENNGIPSRLFFGYYNPLKSNGYEETVEIVEDIAEALNISDEGLIDNDYSSSSKLAIGDYATFTFTNLKLELTVSNSDGEVEIEIVPID